MEEYDFFDKEEVERIESAEILLEPDEAEAEAEPDINEFTTREINRFYQEHHDWIESEARYRMGLYKGSHLLVSFDDLVHEGFLGFLHGARKYDASKGASIRTYTGYWVRKYIREAVQDALLNYQYLDYETDGDKTAWRTGVTMTEAEFTFENDYFRTNANLPVYDSNPESSRAGTRSCASGIL